MQMNPSQKKKMSISFHPFFLPFLLLLLLFWQMASVLGWIPRIPKEKKKEKQVFLCGGQVKARPALVRGPV